jgi:hypothetical protein
MQKAAGDWRQERQREAKKERFDCFIFLSFQQMFWMKFILFGKLVFYKWFPLYLTNAGSFFGKTDGRKTYEAADAFFGGTSRDRNFWGTGQDGGRGGGWLCSGVGG